MIHTIHHNTVHVKYGNYFSSFTTVHIFTIILSSAGQSSSCSSKRIHQVSVSASHQSSKQLGEKEILKSDPLVLKKLWNVYSTKTISTKQKYFQNKTDYPKTKIHAKLNIECKLKWYPCHIQNLSKGQSKRATKQAAYQSLEIWDF